MASTRDFVSLGEFAKNADEVQEPGVPVRVQGEAYRNTSFTQFQQQIGKQFNIIPVSENVNEQIYNQTQFTDLINTQGMPGWSSIVSYQFPSVVLASDGNIYFNKKDDNLNIDPVGAINQNEDFWGKYVGGEDLSNIYASQVPESEGARLVGTTNTPDTYKFPRKGETLQKGLDRNTSQFYAMNNMKILAEMTDIVEAADFPQKNISQKGVNYNIDTADIFLYSKTVPTDPENDPERIGFLRINFTIPIPVPYIAVVSIENNKFLRTTLTTVTSPTKPVIRVKSLSTANHMATSIDIGALFLTNPPKGFDAYWPANWGNEDPQSRLRWYVALRCFTFD